jgi:hypothetical protein
MIAYERAALSCMLNRALDGFVARLATEAKAERLTKKQIRLVEIAARKGVPAAQKLLANLKERVEPQ